MPQRESAIEGKVVKWARDHGYLTVKLQLSRGWPDRLFLFNGRAVFIEFKQPGGRATVMQEIIIERIRAQGIKAFVCDNIVEAIAILERMDWP